MNEQEKIRIAKRAIEKRWSYDDLHYGDDLNGREEYADDVWGYVTECEEIGTIAFNEKYSSLED